tara:strand:- start:233 stop:1888 length:1656 start_codon:yes stop_codon:yes gene_type:complete
MSEKRNLESHLINTLDDNEAFWEPEIKMYPNEFPLRRLIECPKEFYSPQGFIQRLLKEWAVDRKNSYLYDLFSGASTKDLFIFAALEPIIDRLKVKLSEASDKDEIATIKENLQYFEDLWARGVRFLVIDGQHRLNEIHKYFKLGTHNPYIAPTVSKLSKIQKRLDGIKVRDKDGNIVPYVMNNKSWSELPKNLRSLLLDEIKVVVTMVASGDIHSLKGLFGKANDGDPIPFFVRLLTDSFGVTWRYITELINTERQSDLILKLEEKFHGFSNQYAPSNMGLAYVFSEMLCYIASKYGQDRTLPLKMDMKDTLEILYDFVFTGLDKNMRVLHSKILKIIGDGMAPNHKKLKGLGRAELADMFILTSMLLDNTHPTRPYKSGPKYKINNPVRYIEAVMEMLITLKVEDFWLKDSDGNDVYRIDVVGNKVRAKNPDSYKEHQRAIWDDGNLRHRERMMWNKFTTKFLPTLEEQNIISIDGKAVTNQSQMRMEVACRDDFKDKYGKPLNVFDDVLGQNKSHDLGHIIAKSKGGSNSIENLEYEPISANRSKGNA